MMKSTIVFDFDYTLADSSKGVFESINYALKSMGEEPQLWEACCATIGLSLSDTYKTLTGKNDPDSMATFHRLFVERADQVMTSGTNIYAGVSELLPRLASSGFLLGILSTKYRYRICQILEQNELTDQFSVIVGGEDVEHKKPDPEGLNLILSTRSLKAEDVILVGDSLTDAETGLRGGVDFIAVLTGTTTEDQFSIYNPKAVLGSVNEIEKCLTPR